jgi:AraC-like DNA-binding protein
MDRHDVSEVVTAEHVAQLHQEDLKVEHKFGCKGLTYWFDEKRKTAFCLVEAPHKEAVQNMHREAHGEIPHKIIEVDANLVESFLGRIEDPETSQNTGLNIINDPAFRSIMVLELETYSILGDDILKSVNQIIINIITDFNGRIVKKNQDKYLASFGSVSKAVLCSLEIQSKIKKISSKIGNSYLKSKIGLSSGVPVTEKESIFEDTIKLADRMCKISKAEIVVSSDVNDLYKSENLSGSVNGEMVFVLTPSDEQFLSVLFDYIEEAWKYPNLKVDDFSKHLGYSKSKLYRKIVSLTNKSPNTFINDYKLTKALELLNKKKGNISEIAFETGFNSLSYFSKCFQKRYSLLPSVYRSFILAN